MTRGVGLPLAVHVCTRNRPASLRRLLSDLAWALDGFDAIVNVYDDSTTESSQRACQRTCALAPVPVLYFGESEREQLVASALAAIPSAEDCLEVGRPLGAPGWDLAGVRFTAMLNGALDGRAAAHLFLDDDIRLDDCSYAGQRFEVDAVRLAKTIAVLVEAETEDRFAAGTPFLGRADLSALEHFEAYLDGGCPGGTSLSFPAVLTSVPSVGPDGPGISGGFLLTTREALRTVPLAKSYNEDWLWLRQLTLAGGVVRQLDIAVVHAGTRWVRLSSGRLFLQFGGEVLNLALALGGESGDRFVGEAFRACAGRLEAVLARARELAGRSATTSAATRALEGAQARVRRTSPATYAAKLSEHLRRTVVWREAFGTVG